VHCLSKHVFVMQRDLESPLLKCRNTLFFQSGLYCVSREMGPANYTILPELVDAS